MHSDPKDEKGARGRKPCEEETTLSKMSPLLFRIAVALCFLAVGLGAFGAHSLKGLLQSNDTIDIWNKAVLYHLTHAVALVALSLHKFGTHAAAYLLIAGIVIFSGSLYLLAVTNVRWLGAITPLGGLCFLAGWGWLFFAPPR
jgi:uncharacterized membrane protein YgdD (TMEM256/DUF423 family)